MTSINFCLDLCFSTLYSNHSGRTSIHRKEHSLRMRLECEWSLFSRPQHIHSSNNTTNNTGDQGLATIPQDYISIESKTDSVKFSSYFFTFHSPLISFHSPFICLSFSFFSLFALLSSLLHSLLHLLFILFILFFIYSLAVSYISK